MAGVTPIENVPHSPHTSINPTYLYNPLDEDYVFMHGGKNYTVPAKSKKLFPEVRAYHGAKHLAKRISYEETVAGIKRDVANDKDPLKWKKVSQATPRFRVQQLMVSFISYPDSVVKKVEEPVKERPESVLKSEPEKKEEPEEKKPIEKIGFKELQARAKEKGVAKFGATKEELIKALK